MKQLIYLSFLFFSILYSCSSQKQNIGTVTKRVKGIVISFQDKEPLPGASVKIKGSIEKEKLVSTDLNGNFEIDVKKGEILEVNFLGFYIEEIIIGEENDYKIELMWNDGSRDKRHKRDVRRMIRKNGGSYSFPD
jgi:hypothetical protein